MPEPLGSQKWLALVLIGTENTVSEVCSWRALAQQEAGLFSPLSCPLFLFKLSGIAKMDGGLTPRLEQKGREARTEKRPLEAEAGKSEVVGKQPCSGPQASPEYMKPG